jgi:hypothetical protein
MNNLNKIFQKNLMNSSNNFILGVYIIYLIIIAFSSIAFCFLYIQKFPNIIDSNYNLILKNIGFLFGDLIHNLYNHNTYSFKAENDIIFHLRRLPALVFVIFSLYSLCKNFFFIIISKNIILYSLYFLIIYKSLKIKNKKKNILFFILLIFVPVIVPYNYLVSLNFTFEDCLITLFLPLLYFLLIFNYGYQYILISLLLFILYFTKGSMFFLVIILPFLKLIYEKKNRLRFLPLLFCLTAVLIWGFYGKYSSGRFPFASNLSTDNSRSLYPALNLNFHNYYPEKSIDLVPVDTDLPSYINTEWEFQDYYNKKNQEYLLKNYKRYFLDFFIKLKSVFTNIKRDGAFPDKNGNYDNSLRYSLIINKLFFNFALFYSLYSVFKNFKTIQREEYYFLCILILSLLAHLYAWAYSRHLVGMTNLSIVYLIFKFEKKINFYISIISRLKLRSFYSKKNN